ncbi:dTDP-4-dehydrorhamnose reductase [Dechloromonas sp. XY25]|uniref:dTDP-4-dehydrorhamnose reductase n=1 Tax=Dechloromonas hankyongensis TaxID=2908002 RepID=A0ABS9K3S0_9RHOO|nr:dTDP-4-dehydrorhamnose reductase [Dechloromonas hankyongensis]MCG2577803.1 dTDP-4-dehydrorhamnose reductase [Dechloromonas hankyongensis]
MRILLTGKNGQVGFELQRALAPLGEVIAVDQHDCDLANPDAIRQLLARVQPNVIVNPAAYTAVDRAESERELALAINGGAPGVFGDEAARRGALVVHYSTDYVFDGVKDGAYSENDVPNPQSVYGKTKLAGEQALQASGADHLIFRTSWVFGAHGGNFAKTMLRLAAERDGLKVVADQFGAPTSAALLADVTAQVLGCYKREGGAGFPFGLYHLVAGGYTSWHEYAQTVVRAALSAGKSLKLTADQVLPITTADYPLPASRPSNSRLDTHRLRQTFGLELPVWQSGLDHVLQQIL